MIRQSLFSLIAISIATSPLANPAFAQSKTPTKINGAKVDTPSATQIIQKPSEAAKPKEPVTYYTTDVIDPDTGESREVRFQYVPTDPAILRLYSPKNIEQTIARFKAQHEARQKEMHSWRKQELKSRGLGNGIKHMAMDFPAEWLGFTIAIALSSSINAGNDPALLRTFWNTNIADPMSYGSFAAFIAGSRLAHAGLRWQIPRIGNLAYDPLKAPLDYTVATSTPPSFIAPSNSVLIGDGRVVPIQEPTLLNKQAPGSKLYMPMGAGGQMGALDLDDISHMLGQPATTVHGVRSRPSPPNATQRMFAPLVGPLTMAAGMFISSGLHEYLMDDNVSTCSLYHSQPWKIPAGKSGIDACEKAYEVWTLSNKAGDYAPDALAMGIIAVIQAYGVNKLLGLGVNAARGAMSRMLVKEGVQTVTTGIGNAARVEFVTSKATQRWFIPVVMRGIQVSSSLAQYTVGWQFKVGMMAANVAVFMLMLHPLTPWLKKPFESWRNADRVGDQYAHTKRELERLEKNDWVWTPRKLEDICGSPAVFYKAKGTKGQSFEQTCGYQEEKKPGLLLKQLANNQKKWRDFLMADSMAAHQNWQKYVSDFTSMYVDATRAYSQILAYVNVGRFSPDPSNIPLLKDVPYYGVYSTIEKAGTKGAESLPIKNARAWLETFFKYPSMQKGMRPERIADMRTIQDALRRSDPATPISEVAPRMRDFARMSPDQQALISRDLRAKAFDRGMSVLFQVLREDAVFYDRGFTYGTEGYQREAEHNPFMRLRLILGNPDSLPPGVSLMNEINELEAIIGKENKNNHPMALGRAATPKKIDYMVASMVCGPEIDPKFNKNEKVSIYLKSDQAAAYRDKMDMDPWEKFMDWTGWNARPVNVNDPDVMIAVQEYIDNESRPSRSYNPNGGKFAVAHEWKNIKASFRPPRVVDDVVPKDICTALPRGSSESSFNIYTTKFTFGGETYNGFLDIIQRRARASLIGTSGPPERGSPEWAKWEFPFGPWWQSKVDTHVKSVVDSFRHNFLVDVMAKEYLPTFTREGAGDQIRYGGYTLKTGVIPALMQDMEENLEILEHTAKLKGDAKATEQFATFAHAVRVGFGQMEYLVKNVNFAEVKGSVANARYKYVREEIAGKLLKNMKTWVERREITTKASADVRSSEPNSVNAQALKNLDALLSEMDSYWAIVRTIEMEGY